MQEVTIDADFARFGNKSYAINKINTVEVRSERLGGNAGWIILSIIVVLFLFAMLGSAVSEGSPRTEYFIIVVLLGGWAWALKRRAKRERHSLFLMTSSSEAQALQSEDKEMILGLRDQIERAMAGKLV